jgi:hypothetical protein
MRKKFLCGALLLTVGLSFGQFGQAVFAADLGTNNKNASITESVKNHEMTVSQYENWLETQVNSASGNDKVDLKVQLEKFKALSDEKKAEIVKYVNNPEFIIKSFEKSTKSTKNQVKADSLESSNIKHNNSTVNNINSDVKVITTTVTANEKSKIKTLADDDDSTTYKATQSRVLEIAGVDIVKTTGWVRYHHDDSKIVSVDDGNFLTDRNLLPLCTSSWSKVSTYKDGDKAVASADLSFNFVYKSFGPTIGSASQGVTGNVDEEVDGWLTPYES